MKWNLRLAAANRGIWKASELQRMLADRGMVISAGKMSGLWSGRPNTVRLDELEVICTVLGCGVDELLIPEPDTVADPALAAEDRTAAAGEAALEEQRNEKSREALLARRVTGTDRSDALGREIGLSGAGLGVRGREHRGSLG